ncbi:MAG: response regulator transcription factor, partial [Solirubrobacteraceae bacterium]
GYSSPTTSVSSGRASPRCSDCWTESSSWPRRRTGDDALALADEHQPEVMLKDLRMPRLDGIEATRRLRQRHPGARVIALTTYADDESVLGHCAPAHAVTSPRTPAPRTSARRF